MTQRDGEDYFADSKFVTELTHKDFESVATWRLKTHKCSIVLFYAPWCPHCKALKDIWISLGTKAAFFDVCAMNCEKNKVHMAKIKEDMPELVNGYPTIIIYKNGDPVENVGGSKETRTVGHLIKACMRACKEPMS